MSEGVETMEDKEMTHPPSVKPSSIARPVSRLPTLSSVSSALRLHNSAIPLPRSGILSAAAGLGPDLKTVPIPLSEDFDAPVDAGGMETVGGKPGAEKRKDVGGPPADKAQPKRENAYKRARMEVSPNESIVGVPARHPTGPAPARLQRAASASNLTTARVVSRPPVGKAADKKPPVAAKRVAGPAPARPAVSNVVRFNAPQPSLPAAAAPPPPVGKKRDPWDMKGRLGDMEVAMGRQLGQNQALHEQMLVSNERIALLEGLNSQLSGTIQLKEQRTAEASDEIDALQRQLRGVREELNAARALSDRERRDADAALSLVEGRKAALELDVGAARQEICALKGTIGSMGATQAALEAELYAVKLARDRSELVCSERADEISALKASVNAHLDSLAAAERKLRADEAERRRLHNTIQELKGNIRVFCRVRPLLGAEETLGCGSNEAIPHIHFPDDDRKKLELERLTDISPNESLAAGRKGTSNRYEFGFDRVFAPTATQSDVFEEISQLVQSALDGYNVCIFAYGQTGSGKTYTMEGRDEQRGVVPRAVEFVFSCAEQLEVKGWKYDFEVSFLEIYNETIRDLLTQNAKADVKHEIKLVSTNSSEVYVSDLTTVTVQSQGQVQQLLARAARNRSVAETRCNEHSSRSHSVFRMKISGTNPLTGEACVGTLNLIDLAGSERLKDSGSQGQRLKETKSINKSLANLGNVIIALSNKGSYVPYRDSKLTFLLQNCLGGTSKVLMFVNVSPREECFQETLNSLRFAVKVNECNVGTAQKKVVK